MRSGVTPDNGPNDPRGRRAAHDGSALVGGLQDRTDQRAEGDVVEDLRQSWQRRDVGEPALGDGEVQPGDGQTGERAPSTRRRRGSTAARTPAHASDRAAWAANPRARPDRPSTSPAARAAPSTGRRVTKAWTVDGAPLSTPATTAAATTWWAKGTGRPERR